MTCQHSTRCATHRQMQAKCNASLTGPPSTFCPSIALQVVLLPVIAGAALNTTFPKQVAALGPLSALSAVVLIALICGSVMAQNAADVIAAGPKLLACVFALHAGEWHVGRAALVCAALLEAFAGGAGGQALTQGKRLRQWQPQRQRQRGTGRHVYMCIFLTHIPCARPWPLPGWLPPQAASSLAMP